MKKSAAINIAKKATVRSRGEHQNIGRATLVLAALSQNSKQGMRLTDLSRVTGLGKGTVHRILSGLSANGWIEQEEQSGSYFLGLQILSLAVAAANRFELAQRSAPIISRLADSTQDTVYLSLRSGYDAVCICRHEGSFPIKTITLNVGDRRPLGIGAGSLALLAFLPSDEIEKILDANRVARQQYPINDQQLRNMIKHAQEYGFTYNDERLVRGMSGIGIPVFRSDRMPIAAISVAAISSRLVGNRLNTVVTDAKEIAKSLEKDLSAVFNATILTNSALLRTSS
jgi:DNA-binding IclR family transcriptional regulator